MSDTLNKEYETVIGLEVHAALLTKTKIFCSCKNLFGGEPNSRVCPVCMGLPGALPVLNANVIKLGIRAGLIFNCEISRECFHDRKNYFYPDLPKAYQISQLATPLCKNGYLDIGEGRRIRIERIHIEEDAGKLIHDSKKGTLLDFNRCGTPLIEIVSYPDIRSGREARMYLEALRSSLLFAEVCDGKMNEGSLRCDINISVRQKGDTDLGTRTEIKNLNSFAFAEKAIDYEAGRQIELLLAGERIEKETRRYDEKSGKTVSMRKKENAEDYRYFPEPDLPPFTVSEKMIENEKKVLPLMPSARKELYIKKYGLNEEESGRIAQDPLLSLCFDSTATLTAYPKILSSLLVCELPVIIKELQGGIGDDIIPVSPQSFAELCDLQGSRRINSSASKLILRELAKRYSDNERNVDVSALVKEMGLMQMVDRDELLPIVMQAMESNPQAVFDYKNGKQAALKSLIGAVMKLTHGKADPILTAELLSFSFEKEKDQKKTLH